LHRIKFFARTHDKGTWLRVPQFAILLIERDVEALLNHGCVAFQFAVHFRLKFSPQATTRLNVSTLTRRLYLQGLLDRITRPSTRLVLIDQKLLIRSIPSLLIMLVMM